MVISELTLNGILHLFALLSSCNDSSGRANAREVVGAYLTDYLCIVNIEQYRNKSLVDLVRNRDNLDDYRITPLKIVRLSDPIFTKELSPWGGAPFFAGIKRIGNGMVSTYRFDLGVLWMASCLLYAALYWNLLAHLLGFGTSVRNLYQKAFKRS